VTAVACLESSHRFKILRPCRKIGRSLAERQLVFASFQFESFSLRETRLDVHLGTFAAPTTLRPARIKDRGGRANRRRCARSDALQAIVELEPIAIWATEICVEISQGVLVALGKTERYDTVDDNGGDKRSERATWAKTGGTSGVAEQFLTFRCRRSD
jgi:hypothetical protein